MTTEYLKVFTGTLIIIKGLKNILEDNAILPLIKDHTEAARLGGFGLPMNSVELFILKKDLQKAQPIIDDFKIKIIS